MCSQKKTSKVVAALRAIRNPSQGPQEKVQKRAHKAKGIKPRLLRQETLSQKAKNPAGKVLRLIQDRPGDVELQKSRLSVKTIRRKCESPLRVPEMQSTSHPHAQRTAFRRRDVRRQSRSFVRLNPPLKCGPSSNRFLEIVSDDLLVLHAQGRSNH